VILSLGIVTSSIGVVGIYIARVFKQTQDRPKYIIKKVFD
jgi:putative glycosyltransferase